MPWIILGAVVLFLLWIAAMYNGFVKIRHHLRDSWSGIETELKRRYDLIPNLVETVKGYAQHERDTLEAVIRARQRAADSHGTPGEQARDENELVRELRTLFATVERYPELKASEHFLKLQDQLANTEDRIQAARRFYNANVRDMNTRVESFPTNIIAGLFGFERAEYFEVESAAVREVPAVRV